MTNRISDSTSHSLSVGVFLFWQVFLIAASFASYYLRSFTDSLLLYLPIALAIVLIHWYGWRVVLLIYINAIVTLIIWKAQGPWWRILLMATHEPLVAIVSKILVDSLITKKRSGYFHSNTNFVLFVLYGIAIPCLVNSLYVYHYSFVNGNLEKVTLVWLADFLTILIISVPMLYFLNPDTKKIVRLAGGSSFVKSSDRNGGNRLLAEFTLTLLVFIVLSFWIPFERYWFIYGMGSVIIGVRHGFEWVILINIVIFILNYILPLIHVFSSLLIQGSTQLTNVHLGSATMMFMSMVVGRVVSDLRQTENDLGEQKAEMERANQELSRANEELDRFVYSVSHDLSAPLKSIQGLINISKLEPASSPYLDKMEKSVSKLEEFINEVLDYSRTNRQALSLETVVLKQLLEEVLARFTYIENFDRLMVVSDLKVTTVKADRFLLKVILSNLVSNAIKYHRNINLHKPKIELLSHLLNGQIYISVKDNGEGIQDANREKIFEMFYRGSASSTGSGLGLYIAREAAQKLGGSISFDSKYGEGATFTLVLNAG
jgi:two-component system, sensor histidine kinase